MNPTPEMIEAILRQHIKVDATGLAPAVASAFVVGIEEAAREISALALLPGELVGWQLVPKELTTEMREALMMIRQQLGSTLMDNADEIYSAFLSWAPKSSASPAPLPVAVKELEWEEPRQTAHYPEWRAHNLTVGFKALIDTHEPICFGKFPLRINDTMVKEKFSTVEAAKAYAQSKYEEAVHDIIRSALSSPASPQCCMCGKKGLSTVEGDGGPECELSDGRWVCSAECWDKAVELTPASDIAALREENERLRAIALDIQSQYIKQDAAIKVLKRIEHWAQSRCPCHEETPNPCPLCGASVENLEACKAVENIFPRDLLADLRSSLYQQEESRG